MKVAIIYNRESNAVINLFGVPNREKYGIQTINKIKSSIKECGHTVKTFEGDKNIVYKLEEFMPSVISGERPGLVFNLSYGIQGRARYTHVPGILEMLGIPYIGSDPLTHALALDKVVTKMILIQKGLPTPKFYVLEYPDDIIPEKLDYPLIIKPKDEAVSFGLKIVNNENELREGTGIIYDMFKKPTLVEEYIDGNEINVALLGNNPVEALPPVELKFTEGEKIYTYEDKRNLSGRIIEKICPAQISKEKIENIQSLAISAFKALGCFDCARVDFRIDKKGNPYILEVNSMASLGPESSLVFAAQQSGINYTDLVNELIEIASERYFGSRKKVIAGCETKDDEKKSAFNYLTLKRDKIEEELKSWTNLPSWTNDPVGLSSIIRQLDKRLKRLGLKSVEELTNMRSAWTWETCSGYEDGILLVTPLDIPGDKLGYTMPFRREPERLFGEGIASSRAGLVCILQCLETLKFLKKMSVSKIGMFVYSDEGRGMRYSSRYLKKAADKAKEVFVLQPGYAGGKVVNQRRGSRKFSIVVEGGSMRIGTRSNRTDVLTWFLQRVDKINGMSEHEKKLSVVVQDVHSERYSMLMPHRVKAAVYITYLDSEIADYTEKQIKEIFKSDTKSINSYVEKLEERPPMLKINKNKNIIVKLKEISEEWKLPFGIESSLLPSAAGEISQDIPVLCGLAPASYDMYTPQESIHRGELIQKTLLLTFYLLNKIK